MTMEPPLPLQRYELLRSRDIDHMREAVAGVMSPHRLNLTDPERGLNARIHSLPLRNLVLNYVHYGAEVFVDPGRTDTFLALQIPLAGFGVVRGGCDEIDSTTLRMAVTTPSEPLSMALSRDARLLLVKVPWRYVEDVLRDMLGDDLRWKLRFELGFDVATGLPQRWFHFLWSLVKRANSDGGLFAHRLWAAEFEQRLITGLLLAHASNYSAILNASPRTASVRSVRQAIDMMEAIPEQRGGAGSLARDLGVSVPALGAAFQRHCGFTASSYLYDVRLRRARAELLRARPGTVTVEEIAAHWGFVDYFHFLVCYRKKFRELPQQTLDR